MTKKDFELHARIVNAHLRACDEVIDLSEIATIMAIAKSMADAYAADNPSFNRQRFLVACTKGTGIDPE